MPNKNKAVCKRRKCQRSRSQRRQNNNRRTRTIRGGISPFRKLSEWNKTRRANATARQANATARRDSTNKATYQPANLWSPRRKWREWRERRNTNRVAPAHPSHYDDIARLASDSAASRSAVAAPAYSRNTAVATPATPATPARSAYYDAASAAIDALPPAGKIHLPLPPAGTVVAYPVHRTELTELQKESLSLIAKSANESPHIRWTAAQLLNPDKISNIDFNKLLDFIFIGDMVQPGGFTWPGTLDDRFKLFKMITPTHIKSLKTILTNLLKEINISGEAEAKLNKLQDLFKIFATLRREYYCADVLKTVDDLPRPIKGMIYSTSTLPIALMYEEILKTLDYNKAENCIKSQKRWATYTSLYLPTNYPVLDLLLKFGGYGNRNI